MRFGKKLAVTCRPRILGNVRGRRIGVRLRLFVVVFRLVRAA